MNDVLFLKRIFRSVLKIKKRKKKKRETRFVKKIRSVFMKRKKEKFC